MHITNAAGTCLLYHEHCRYMDVSFYVLGGTLKSKKKSNFLTFLRDTINADPKGTDQTLNTLILVRTLVTLIFAENTS